MEVVEPYIYHDEVILRVQSLRFITLLGTKVSHMQGSCRRRWKLQTEIKKNRHTKPS